MKIIAFGASYSKNSINKTFAHYAARQLGSTDVELLDLCDFPLPLYTVDLEMEAGIPESAKAFLAKIQSADLLVISLAEHNGSYTAAFKNLFDWVSRLDVKMFANRRLLLLSTAPGPRGGLGVMEAALTRFPLHGATIVGNFSLPKFQAHFSEQTGIADPALRATFDSLLAVARGL